jgi:hypothetical protein
MYLKGNTFYKAFNSFQVLPKKKNILFAFMTGDDAAFAENLSDECLVEVLHEIFTKIFSYLNLPKPTQIIRFGFCSFVVLL